MTAETGNDCISETMKGAVKIPTTNLQYKYKTMYRWKIVLASKYNSDRPTTGNTDIAPKTGNNYISGILTDSVEISTPNSGFSMMTSSIQH